MVCWKRFFRRLAGVSAPAPRFSMKQNWFETKTYGIGWKPITWQGWAVSLTYLAFIIATFMWVDRASHSASDTLIGFAPFFIFSTSISVFISRVKSEKHKFLPHAQKL